MTCKLRKAQGLKNVEHSNTKCAFQNETLTAARRPKPRVPASPPIFFWFGSFALYFLEFLASSAHQRLLPLIREMSPWDSQGEKRKASQSQRRNNVFDGKKHKLHRSDRITPSVSFPFASRALAPQHLRGSPAHTPFPFPGLQAGLRQTKRLQEPLQLVNKSHSPPSQGHFFPEVSCRLRSATFSFTESGFQSDTGPARTAPPLPVTA